MESVGLMMWLWSANREASIRTAEQIEGPRNDPLEAPASDASSLAAVMHWQSGLLHLLLVVSGSMALGASLLVVLFLGTLPAFVLPIGGMGLGLLAASRLRLRDTRGLSAAFVAVVFLCIVYLGWVEAWATAVTTALCLLLVAAGLLVGWRASALLLVATSAALGVAGLLVQAGIYSPVLRPEHDPTSFANWVRSGLMFFVVAGGGIFVLRYAVEVLTRAEVAATASIRELRREVELLEATRLDRLASESRVQDAQKLATVGQLGDGFSHLFNNVLTVVRSALETLCQETSSAERKRAASLIVDVTRGAADRIRDLLLFSRPHSEPVAALDLDAALLELEPKLRQRLRGNIHCELDPCGGGQVRISSSWLEQMVMNLAVNAQQAMPAGGRLVLRAHTVHFDAPVTTTGKALAPGSYAALTVADSGPGFTSDALQRAWEPFFTTKGRESHDGLGLTVVQGMVRSLDGAMVVRNTEMGAEVTVLLSMEGTFPPPASAPADRPSFEATATSFGMGSSIAAPRPARGPALDREEQSGSAEAPPRTSPAAPAASVVPEWQRATLPPLLRATAVVFAVAPFVVSVFMNGSTVRLVAVVGAAGAVLAWLAARGSGWPFPIRVATLVCCLLGGGAVTMLRVSYLAPEPVAGLFLGAMLAAIYLRRNAALGILAAATATFVLGGWLHHCGVLGVPLATVSPAHAENWFRIATVLPLASLLQAFTVLHLLSWARQRVTRLADARAQLQVATRQRAEELEALARAEALASRIGRMQAAGQITGLVAHDLNNCLQGLAGWADLLRDAPDAPAEETEEARAGMQQAAAYAEALIHQLQVDVTCPTTSDPLDLRQALERMRGMLEASLAARGKGSSLTVECEADCHVAIDEPSLRRLLLNLVANSRDAMPAKGSCRVRGFRQDTHVCLAVSDTGSGMTPEVRQRAFDAFFTTKTHQGSGLGLHSVARIVEASHGTIELESQPGVGTTVLLRWPGAEAPPAQVARQRNRRPSPQARGRVLLAEDDARVRLVLSRGLERAGYDVLAASDGDEAATWIESGEPIDALCTDAIMPGRPATRLIRDFCERYPGKPVVLMSGHLPSELEADAFENPRTRFLRKPFVPAALVAELEQ